MTELQEIFKDFSGTINIVVLIIIMVRYEIRIVKLETTLNNLKELLNKIESKLAVWDVTKK